MAQAQAMGKSAPKMAKGALPHYADGGFIGSLKRAVMGETLEAKAKRLGIDVESATPQKPAAPVEKPVAPPPAKAISSYAGNTALKRREEIAGLKVGGAIRGPGTGTSDDVPIMASNGEFMIKAAAVKKIGLPVLEALNDIADDETDAHESGESKKVEAQEMLDEKAGRPERDGMKAGGAVRRMATGGLVTEEDKAKLANQTAMYVQGAQAANPPQQIQAVAPPVAAAPAVNRTPMDATALADRDMASQLFAGAKDMNSRAGAAIADVALLAPRGLAGAYDSAVIRPMRAAGVNADYLSPKLIPNGANPESMTPFYDQIRARDANPVPATVVAPNAATPTARGALPQASYSNEGRNYPAPSKASAAQPSEVAPVNPLGSDGVAVAGTNALRFDRPGQSPLYTDKAGIGSSQRMVSRPAMSENDPGMQGIQARQDAGDAQRMNAYQYEKEVQAAQSAQAANNEIMARPETGGFGLLDRNKQEARNAFTLAERGAVRSQQEGRLQSQTAREKANLAAKTDMARAMAASKAASEANATQRYGIDARTANEKEVNATTREAQGGQLGIAREKLALDKESQGYDNRAKGALEKLQNRLDAAKTDTERAEIMKIMRSRQGKASDADEYAYAPGGQAIDPVTGQVTTQPGVIFNKRTGQEAQRQQISIAADPRAAAIRDNKSMTREQKQAALQKMGYQ